MGTTTVTCTASDTSGNTVTDSFTVTVISGLDETPPVVTITEPAFNLTTENPAGKSYTYLFPTATDDVGVVSGPTCNYPQTYTYPVGSTTVTCSATDAAGNVGTATMTFTVSLAADTTPPVLNVPSNIVTQTTAGPSAFVKVPLAVTATDNVGIGPTITAPYQTHQPYPYCKFWTGGGQ